MFLSAWSNYSSCFFRDEQPFLSNRAKSEVKEVRSQSASGNMHDDIRADMEIKAWLETKVKAKTKIKAIAVDVNILLPRLFIISS